jgi:hypothetical protein
MKWNTLASLYQYLTHHLYFGVPNSNGKGKNKLFDNTYNDKIRRNEAPYVQIADELVFMLWQESLNPKYRNNGHHRYQRSITLHELTDRLTGKWVNLPHPIEISRTVQAFLNRNGLKNRYERKKRSSKGSVYSCISYSQKNLDELVRTMIEIMEESSALYGKLSTFS